MTLTQLLLLPVFIHVLLVTYVGLRSVKSRIASARGGETKVAAIALSPDAWPTKVRQLGNNFDNQYDVPTTWYALCGLLIATGKVDLIFVVLSWIFVATRIAHTIIHIGKNYVPYRMYAFLSGFACLFVMWVWFAVRLFVV
jgi:hypothetical protein